MQTPQIRHSVPFFRVSLSKTAEKIMLSHLLQPVLRPISDQFYNLKPGVHLFLSQMSLQNCL